MIERAKSAVLGLIRELSSVALQTYVLNRDRIEEDANAERRIYQGGYGDRQIYELVQNGADEMRAPEHEGGTIRVVLTSDSLYVANDGEPITVEGARTILRMGVSRKRGGQIGRFGVGIKSVLSATLTPQFFSSTGSFGFDADWAAEQILGSVNADRELRGELPVESVGDTPVLRMARELDEVAERAQDPVLDELLGSGAATVVRLRLLSGAADRLGVDLEKFPKLFQLFSHQVRVLALEDRRTLPVARREITVDYDGILHTIREACAGQKAHSERHRVFTRLHEVSEASRDGAGELHQRSEIEIAWAVPDYTVTKSDDGRRLLSVPHERGRFWAFFPTTYPTTLSGALNAAWKTNEDRQNLLDGSPLNDELLDEAADLVVSSLPALVEPADPAAYLQLLPGRTKESPNWADEFLVDAIWRLAAVRPSLPDQDGVLRAPAELRVHPEKVDRVALEMWAEYAGRAKNWLHRSAEANTLRRGKVNHILAGTDVEPETADAWLEALVEDGSAAGSAAAIQVAAYLDEIGAGDRALRMVAAEARQAKIVLTDSGEFVAPADGGLFRRTDDDGLADDLVYVARSISDDPDMADALDRLGIRPADARGRFQSVLDQGFRDYDADAWTRFWELLRSAGGVELVDVIRAKLATTGARLRVLTKSGALKPVEDCLLPGPVVPADGSRDAAYVVDLDFHGDDLAVLRELGMTDVPVMGLHPKEQHWFHEYHVERHAEYCASLDSTASRVQLTTVGLTGQPTVHHLHVFLGLSADGKAAFLAEMPDEGLVEHWSRQIGVNVRTRTRVESPVRWLLRQHGFVSTSMGVVRLVDAVAPELAALASVLPVADLSTEKARRLGLSASAENVEPARWVELFQRVGESVEDEFVGNSYALLSEVASDLLEQAEMLRCRVGGSWDLRPHGEIAVAAGRAEYDELVREKHPAILVDDAERTSQVEVLVRELGLRAVGDVILKQLRAVHSGPPVGLGDEYTSLKLRLGVKRVQGLKIQRCSELEEVIRTPHGTRTVELRSARQDDMVLVPEDVSFEEALVLADEELCLGLGAAECRRVVQAHHDQLRNSEVQQRLSEIRGTDDLDRKIVLLIGAENLRQGLPEGLVAREIAATGQEPDDLRLARMAYNAHATSVLRVHTKDINERFGTAPAQFDGSHAALRFVTDLGLPDIFAGVRVPSPPARVEVFGPTAFPPLHGYQETIAGSLEDLLTTSSPQRAMLSLPTAAGKTRVAAEATIRRITTSGPFDGPVLWIAQTAELCEQAVQTWRYVWERIGPDEPLVIDRLWSGNSATPVTGRSQLVVATDAKLSLVLGTDEYAWLRNAATVFVDEAHVAISPEYTGILEHLGLTHRATARHLVGLTATPFRSNTELTRRLVQRFGNQRLDDGVFAGEPILELQDLGVLARVEHRELVGAEIELDSQELTGVKGFLPRRAEQRLAENETRNKLIIEEIAALPEDWPVLVFATSVSHAKFLAAMLCDRGVRSAAIDSATPPPERRQRVESFRRGELRVLTNYGVLTQGFDAPATRAVVIARPVYSPNDYQQMIGRGLRGNLNGGKDTCLILDVRDNITNYDGDLAFRSFEYLWQKG
ncbi:Superfamily II DNA or RNA helicase [Lentzea albidocapillata subsp. violacea]|uniref:Superfamily II DNA or RNA helicase n=1 Tax=Lentzea albidocapillata subsp. violacea TaxID=128104 RepID=A0A1G8XIC5_9PSEU|nr:DEAD/DEAH box helicase [Lentzea albidocapillata]SDJ89984.1 Superfamily II DNA or RNA helicase [Lentzea albidocapillata subsp. violacea]